MPDNVKTTQNDDPTASNGSTTDPTTSTTRDDSTNVSADEPDFNDLKKQLEETQTKLKEMTVITQHALADLQNSRRRAEEERASYIAYANADLINELLPVLENTNKALAHEPKDQEWIKGAVTTMVQFQNTLSKRGLTPIEAKDKPFDPKIHEALMVGPGPKDQITDEFEKGYMLGDKVLKRSRVKVGNGSKE